LSVCTFFFFSSLRRALLVFGGKGKKEDESHLSPPLPPSILARRLWDDDHCVLIQKQTNRVRFPWQEKQKNNIKKTLILSCKN